MKSVVSWHYLMADIRAIRNWNVASVRLKSGPYVLRWFAVSSDTLYQELEFK